MDKKIRNHMKKALKKKIQSILPEEAGLGASFDDETKTWKVGFSMDFEIPAGLERRVKGMKQDEKRSDVMGYMESKQKEIIRLMVEHFSAIYIHPIELDFNFTVPFPPMYITRHDGETVRFLTEVEKQELKQISPTFKQGIEYDERVLKDGFYSFVEGMDNEMECFVANKYSTLRARYTFLISLEDTGLEHLLEKQAV
ncbi:hypothetical protein PP175_26035 (plasmid) [Aneurinibacillus sp. Ricciae_BoGa-3]|uniref:hypothetical protein n=1 Tax=Aneurinibacillus sp. Ricciae_BoGa-3 TaxID=3022697 RepID=UPI00234175CC|nr:hypothetical protein [Aneurinibacillus sp. Ricciae_BoGa-3]WCK57527.1 hypothetical protein PP175_26035 [Aneurinibacillus sp. Ricciae_BoGa-3]